MRLALLPAGLLALAGCDKPPAEPAAAAPPPTVFVTRAEKGTITPSVEFIGRVEALGKVDVRARITGFLRARHFEQGQQVPENALLFTIEQEPFAAEVALREAAVERSTATLQFNTTQVQRGRELVRTNALPQATLDQRIAEQAISQGQLSASQAELQQARIQYAYTEIRSPIAGRAGRSPLTPGNVVSPETGVLVTVVSDDTVRVLFPVTQRQLLMFRRQENEGQLAAARVNVRLPDGTMMDTQGRLEFINVTSERTTDSVLVQALVPNPHHLLSDAQAVTVSVQAGQSQEAIIIPQSALQIDQAGPFVLTVGADNKVEVRRIQNRPGPAGQIVVTEGLEVGQLVITEGSQRARPGATVTPRPAVPPPAGAVPANAARPG
ncbi:efflux RND transporter periplasmic adaptor subunit [Roseococcus sp. YIM B11640]|uniref:efflux RND transporter periplasmic adaptor subunit n=1 Tax=Roseococcus sp. YIM B11640 TaxID=3133973 RepID=UPI003C7B4817